MKSVKSQDPARETWRWLWKWVKANRKDEYREKYLAKQLARRIGCHPSAITLWKQGQMCFESEKLERVMEILDEWCRLLPKAGWLNEFHYADEERVQHIVDYREASAGDSVVRCDARCPCGRRTPSSGKYCMHCGKRLPKELD